MLPRVSRQEFYCQGSICSRSCCCKHFFYARNSWMGAREEHWIRNYNRSRWDNIDMRACCCRFSKHKSGCERKG
uniref:Uncharacterized protein n=1 Tax=Arundo donax TaxID=35708 RepID=A0A0A9N712_ARUDO